MPNLFLFLPPKFKASERSILSLFSLFFIILTYGSLALRGARFDHPTLSSFLALILTFGVSIGFLDQPFSFLTDFSNILANCCCLVELLLPFANLVLWQTLSRVVSLAMMTTTLFALLMLLSLLLIRLVFLASFVTFFNCIVISIHAVVIKAIKVVGLAQKVVMGGCVSIAAFIALVCQIFAIDRLIRILLRFLLLFDQVQSIGLQSLLILVESLSCLLPFLLFLLLDSIGLLELSLAFLFGLPFPFQS